MKKIQKTIILIHGAGPKHYRSMEDGSGDWQSQLAEDFGAEFQVLSPQFPSLSKPSYQDWKLLFEKYLAKVKGEVFFVGHSLGGAFLLKYLSEEEVPRKIGGLFLVATPLMTLKGFEVPRNLSALTEIKNIILYHSIDDVEVPYAHAITLRDQLKATLRTFNNQGHYFKRRKFSDVARDINSLDDSGTRNLSFG